MMTPARKAPDMDSYSGRIGQRLRKLRDDSGLSVAEVVKRMARHGFTITEATLRHWENGTRKLDVDAVPSIAKALKIAPPELFPKK